MCSKAKRRCSPTTAKRRCDPGWWPAFRPVVARIIWKIAATAIAGKQVTVDGYEGEVREGNLTVSAWSEHDTPELRELADLARRISPLRAHAHGDYPRLDDLSDAAVSAAMDNGQTDVLADTPLIVMMAALRLAGSRR